MRFDLREPFLRREALAFELELAGCTRSSKHGACRAPAAPVTRVFA
jgi:hypothetical protein